MMQALKVWGPNPPESPCVRLNAAGFSVAWYSKLEYIAAASTCFDMIRSAAYLDVTFSVQHYIAQ